MAQTTMNFLCQIRVSCGMFQPQVKPLKQQINMNPGPWTQHQISYPNMGAWNSIPRRTDVFSGPTVGDTYHHKALCVHFLTPNFN